jgi:gas vesicle protein
MAIPAKLKALDEIGEKYRDLYRPMTADEQGTGAEGFVLEVMRVDNWGLEDVGSLKTALQKHRASDTLARKELKAVAALAEEQGTDIQGLPGMIEAAFAAAKNPGEASEAVEARLKLAQDQHNAAVAKLQTENGELRSSYEQSQVESEIAAAVAEAGGSFDLLGPLLAQRVKPITQENGKIVARPVDSNGNPLLTNKTGEVGDMTVSEFIHDLKNDSKYAGAFAGQGVSGTGTTSAGARRAAGTSALDNLPATDHIGRMQAAAAEVARSHENR